ncbi:DUF4238 domain-containing protein [Pseudarthrobacter sp. fls2-241-R2A-168]|uniref:DUF4238 domain-containing protein n=1 Tax=Pseudarthrobacter sp. fls2-241-R2A-168 TaxID=3040304 RepID=UPI00255286C7|nr:DUF4238 domain-containing protein [Pseudarthrobacter sp. fls2-241-R2A-168]
MITGSNRGADIEFTPALAELLDRARNEKETNTTAADVAELRDHPDILALMTRARQNEKNPPRKHHVVPASYLRRWTNDRQIRVTEIDEGRTYITTAEKAARRTDYYSLASDDLEPDELPPLLAETMLSDIESLGKVAIDSLLSAGVEELSHENRSNLAIFLGFQYVRGESTRTMIRKIANDAFKLEYGQLKEPGIRRTLKERGLPVTSESIESVATFIRDLNDGILTVGPQKAAEVIQAFQAATKIAEHLFERSWAVFRTPAILLTCDEPVVPIGRSGQNRGERTGLAGARVVVFPLAPDNLLVMFQHRPSAHALVPLTLSEIVEINHEVLANTARWAFERPKRRTSIALRVPSLPSATEVVEHRVAGKANTSIIRLFRQSRWAGDPHPPEWPLPRWP